jgi:glycosyltransferase involved in cell wall biosynthesis
MPHSSIQQPPLLRNQITPRGRRVRVTRCVVDQRPTVCHVVHAMGVGGAEVLVDRMVRKMSDSFRCVVAVLDDVGEIGRQLRNDGFTVENLGREPGIDYRCARRLREFGDQQGAVLFHAHQCTPFFQAMLSRGLRGRRPVVLTEHGRHFPDHASLKRTVVNRLLLRRQDRLIGCGGAVRIALIENEGLPDSRVEVIYNGVDLTAAAAATPGARRRIRDEFGFLQDDFVIVQVARLHTLKDHATAIRTIDRLRQAIPKVRLLLAGEGEQRPALELQIQKLGLEHFVKLAGSRQDVPELMAASDAFLLTSISEGIPLTVIEAMAAGLPVVSTAVGGIPEMIRHGETGFLTPAGDDLALAAALQLLHDDRDQAVAIRELAALEARSRFSLESMIDNYRTVYREVIAGQGARR